MKITNYGLNKQYQLEGNVVNVPIDIQTTLDILPRNMVDTQTIQIKLMRRMHYKKAYLHETISPKKKMDALQVLIKSDLYKAHNIKIDDLWFQQQVINENNLICY